MYILHIANIEKGCLYLGREGGGKLGIFQQTDFSNAFCAHYSAHQFPWSTYWCIKYMLLVCTFWAFCNIDDWFVICILCILHIICIVHVYWFIVYICVAECTIHYFNILWIFNDCIVYFACCSNICIIHYLSLCHGVSFPTMTWKIAFLEIVSKCYLKLKR